MNYQDKILIFDSETTKVFSGINIDLDQKKDIIIKEYLRHQSKINDKLITIPFPDYDKEINALNHFKNNYVIKIFGYNFLKNGSYEIFLEKGDCNLEQYIKTKDYKNLEIELIISCIIKGIYHIHSLGFIHGDLKPRNIVCFNEKSFKIIDFDCSLNTNKYFKDDYFLQTTNYKAPEVLLKNEIITKYIDIYSIGLIIYELVNKIPLFNKNNDYDNIEILNNIYLDNGEIKDIYYQNMNMYLRKIFIQTMNINPFNRINSESLIKLVK